MLGNGRLEAQCFDGARRLAHIRGKLRKKVWINQGDIILLSLRDYQDEKGSLRLHVQPPLIPAKYVDIRAEAGALIDALESATNRPFHNPLAATKDAPREYASERSTKNRSFYNPLAASAQPSPHRTQRPVVKSRQR